MLEQLRCLFSGHLLILDHVTHPSLDLKTCCHMVAICVNTPKIKDAAQSKS